METFIGQIVALVTFFAFPIIQYFILKSYSRKEGKPELWYLPAYGFRLVIRNIPNKRALSDIKYRSFVRRAIKASAGSSVSTLIDEILIEKEDFFLLPGYDQIILCFKVIGESENNLMFAFTDKLGKTIKEIPVLEIDMIITDYTANVENLFNFDVKLGKRVVIERESLISYWNQIQLSKIENNLIGLKILNVG